MSLKQELATFAEQMSQQAPKEVLETLGGFIGSIAESGLLEKALRKGDTAPNFSLKDDAGRATTLSELTADKPLVLSFNRGNWCPFCNIELTAWQREQGNLEKANFVMIMPQTQAHSAQIKTNKRLSYQILVDTNNKVAEQFGLKFRLTEPVQKIHNAFGMDIPAHNGEDSYELPLAATYVINQDRIIAYAYLNPNWMERAEPSEVLSQL